jgi:hypothetical protein
MIGKPTDYFFIGTNNIIPSNSYWFYIQNIIDQVMVKQPIKRGHHHHQRQGLEMPDPFPVYKFPDGMPRSCQQLRYRVKDPIVKMEKSVLEVMPDKMHGQFMGIGRLPTIITIIPFKSVVAVFANSSHLQRV